MKKELKELKSLHSLQLPASFVLAAKFPVTMGDPHAHAVFFECPRSLDTEQKRRVEKYFQIRRRSGGGDCGQLKTVADKLYTIGFRDKSGEFKCGKTSGLK